MPDTVADMVVDTVVAAAQALQVTASAGVILALLENPLESHRESQLEAGGPAEVKPTCSLEASNASRSIVRSSWDLRWQPSPLRPSSCC